MRLFFVLLILTFFLFGCGRDSTGIAEDRALTTAAAPAATPANAYDKRNPTDPVKPTGQSDTQVGRDQMAPVESMREGTASPEDVARYSGAGRPAGGTERRAGTTENPPKQFELKLNEGPVMISKIEAPAVFTVAKTPCYGECKQYSLTVHNNGLVVLNAKKNLDRKGFYTVALSTIDSAKMLELFRRATASGLLTVYPAGEEIAADIPSTKLEYAGVNGLPQVIRVYSDAPAALQTLFDEAEKLAEKGDWKLATE